MVWHDLPSGGGKRALFEHVRGLEERGHEVECFTPGSKDTDYLPLSQLVKEQVFPMPIFGPPKPKGRVARARWRWRELRFALEALDGHCARVAEVIDSTGFDILFANTAVRFHAAPIARWVGLPSVLYLQEPQRRLYEALPKPVWAAPRLAGGRLSRERAAQMVEDGFDTWGRRVQVREEIRSAAAFDRILVNSRFSRESLLRSYGLEAEVCYLGVDLEVFHPRAVLRGDHVVGLGMMYFGKGPDRAIRAIASIEEAIRPPLIWIGNHANPRFQSKMEELSRSLDVRLEVRIDVEDEELAELLSSARAMIYAPRLEPFGLAPLEANACGTPVVAVAEGGVRETIEHGVNGLLVDSADPVELGRALRELLERPDRAAEMGQRGREAVEQRWGAERAVDALESHLYGVLEARRGVGSEPTP